MNIRLNGVAALALGCAALAAGGAGAQTLGAPGRFEAGGPDAGRPDLRRAPACAPLCFEDYSPCDPPVFKRADGRCETRSYGRR